MSSNKRKESEMDVLRENKDLKDGDCVTVNELGAKMFTESGWIQEAYESGRSYKIVSDYNRWKLVLPTEGEKDGVVRVVCKEYGSILTKVDDTDLKVGDIVKINRKGVQRYPVNQHVSSAYHNGYRLKVTRLLGNLATLNKIGPNNADGNSCYLYFNLDRDRDILDKVEDASDFEDFSVPNQQQIDDRLIFHDILVNTPRYVKASKARIREVVLEKNRNANREYTELARSEDLNRVERRRLQRENEDLKQREDRLLAQISSMNDAVTAANRRTRDAAHNPSATMDTVKLKHEIKLKNERIAELECLVLQAASEGKLKREKTPHECKSETEMVRSVCNMIVYVALSIMMGFLIFGGIAGYILY